MNTLLDGTFRQYLENHTTFSSLEIRERRETIRRMALDYQQLEDIPFHELSDLEIETLMLYSQMCNVAGYTPASDAIEAELSFQFGKLQREAARG